MWLALPFPSYSYCVFLVFFSVCTQQLFTILVCFAMLQSKLTYWNLWTGPMKVRLHFWTAVPWVWLSRREQSCLMYSLTASSSSFRFTQSVMYNHVICSNTIITPHKMPWLCASWCVCYLQNSSSYFQWRLNWKCYAFSPWKWLEQLHLKRGEVCKAAVRKKESRTKSWIWVFIQEHRKGALGLKSLSQRSTAYLPLRFIHCRIHFAASCQTRSWTNAH